MTTTHTRQNFKSVMNTNRVTKSTTKEITSTVSLNPGMKSNQLEKTRKYIDIKSAKAEKQENIVDYSNNSFGNNTKPEATQPLEKKREKIEKSSVEQVASRTGMLNETTTTTTNQHKFQHKIKHSDVNPYFEQSHVKAVQSNGMTHSNTGHNINLANDIFVVCPQNTNPKLNEREEKEKVFMDSKAFQKFPAHLRTEKSCDSNHMRSERKDSLNHKFVKLLKEPSNAKNGNGNVNVNKPLAIMQNNIHSTKEDSKYSLLLSQYHDIVNERNEMAKAMGIMKCAVEVQEKMLSHSMKKRQEKVLKEMIKLKAENEIITKQNKELKMFILKMFYNIKSFEIIEIAREKEITKNLSQLLTENEYLRTANENVVLNSPMQNEGYVEITFEDTDQNPTEMTNHYQTEMVHCAKPPKGLHKRQKTHYNLHTNNNNLIINTNIQLEKDMTKSQQDGKNQSKETSETSTVHQTSESDDLFGTTLKELGSMNKTMRKAVDNKKPSDVTSPTSNYNSNLKKQALFYRTPGNKEHMKIEFKK